MPLASRHPCHITLKVMKDVDSLRSAKLVNELERTWREACDRRRFRLVQYSIQRDHVHLIVEASSARDLGCGMKSIAARFARAVNRVFRRSGQVLEDRCHVHVLRTPRAVRNAIAYVLLNARRHFRKRTGRLPAGRGIDPASSGRWFDGWFGERVGATDSPAVAEGRTWLLRIGWRRWGLIDVGEVPGLSRKGNRRA
jgi:REP element-mobilizing transposase RayT